MIPSGSTLTKESRAHVCKSKEQLLTPRYLVDVCIYIDKVFHRCNSDLEIQSEYRIRNRKLHFVPPSCTHTTAFWACFTLAQVKVRWFKIIEIKGGIRKRKRRKKWEVRASETVEMKKMKKEEKKRYFGGVLKTDFWYCMCGCARRTIEGGYFI